MSDETWRYFQDPANRRRVMQGMTDQEAGDVLDVAALRNAPEAPEVDTFELYSDESPEPIVRRLASDLDQQIRARLRTTVIGVHTEALARGEALRAVLDLLDVHQQHAEPEHAQGINATAHAVRYSIARALDITEETGRG